jgi:hypothetical protein
MERKKQRLEKRVSVYGEERVYCHLPLSISLIFSWSKYGKSFKEYSWNVIHDRLFPYNTRNTVNFRVLSRREIS